MKVKRFLLPGILCGFIILVGWASKALNMTATPGPYRLNLCALGLEIERNPFLATEDWSIEFNSPNEPNRWWFQANTFGMGHWRIVVPGWVFFIGAAAWTLKAARTPSKNR